MFVYFLDCKVKGSYNLMFIFTWRVLSIHSNPCQALTDNCKNRKQERKVKAKNTTKEK